MQHKESLDAKYFEDMFTADEDPWEFTTSPYEAAKFDHTISAIGGRTYNFGFEVGCANGVLTTRLAELCASLLAIDVSATALSLARQRCRQKDNIAFQRMIFPKETPQETCFDLIVLSEVAYYWDDEDLDIAAKWLKSNHSPGASLLLVHWTGDTDYPQTGDEVVNKLGYFLAKDIIVDVDDKRDKYRLDLWRWC